MPSELRHVIDRIRSYFRRRRDAETDIAEEIRLHLEHRIGEFIAQGLTPEHAKRAAARQFGPVDFVKAGCRDARRQRVWLGSVWQDLRYGLRSLAGDRAFTLASIFTVTIGVGLVTSFFAVFNGILLKPWPLAEPETNRLQSSKNGPPSSRRVFS